MTSCKSEVGYASDISIVVQREYFPMVKLIYDSSMSTAGFYLSRTVLKCRVKIPAMKRKILAIIAGLLKVLGVQSRCCVKISPV